MKIIDSGSVKIDAESFVFTGFNFSGPITVPDGVHAYDAAALEGLVWVESRVAEERARLQEKIADSKKRSVSGAWHHVEVKP